MYSWLGLFRGEWCGEWLRIGCLSGGASWAAIRGFLAPCRVTYFLEFVGWRCWPPRTTTATRRANTRQITPGMRVLLFLYTLVVGHARPTPSVDTKVTVALSWRDTTESKVLAARKNRRAIPTVAESVAAFIVLGALPIGYVFRPRTLITDTDHFLFLRCELESRRLLDLFDGCWVFKAWRTHWNPHLTSVKRYLCACASIACVDTESRTSHVAAAIGHSAAVSTIDCAPLTH